jgi:tetratricopeptide (TPR) repeat protein
MKPASGRLRWHPARLLYVFAVTLVIGILYSEAQAVLADPSSALNPVQLQSTSFWHFAVAYPVYFAGACVLAVGAAVLGWRVEQRYAAVQAEAQREETVVAVLERAQSAGQPLGAARAVPRELPPRAPGFVGRQQDLTQVETSLRDGQAVAIVGMGGLGKSSLAAEAVSALAQEPGGFAGGITWVRCDERAGLEGAIWIEDQLLRAWNAALPSEAVARATTLDDGLELREQALRKRLGASEGEARSTAKLVLLDNVEPGLPLSRLLDTLQPLEIATLVTTRVEPTSQHIRLLNLEVLDADVGGRLFAERYADRGGKWDATRDAAATTSIVEALGALPLAIELAAARAARTRLPLPMLVEELRAPDALARLNDPRDPSAGVRYSLRKTLLALSPSQRVRFAVLGLPEGPDWALPIIERMFAGVPADQEGVPSARDDLEALVAYSLVGLSTPEGSETSRVRLHPLVRELAREEWAGLPADDQEAALSALLTGIQGWTAQHQDDSVTNTHILQLDKDLMADAVRVAAARQTGLPLVIGIVEGWARYLSLTDFALAREMGELRLEAARRLSDRRAEMLALQALGTAGLYSGRRDEVLAYRQAALAIARELGDRPNMLGLLGVLGEAAALEGHSQDAEQMYREANAIARELGNQLTDWGALNSLGALAYGLVHLQEAEKWFQRAIASARAAGEIINVGMSETNLGFVYTQMGNNEAAQRIHEEWLRFVRSYEGVSVGVVVQLNALGYLALRGGDLELASRHLTDALQVAEQLGGDEVAESVRGNLEILRGLEAMSSGDRVAATAAFEEALRLLEASILPAAEERPYVRQLLAAVQGKPA